MEITRSCRKGHLLTSDNSIGIKRKRCKICSFDKYAKVYDRYRLKTREESFNDNKELIESKFKEFSVVDGDHRFYIGSNVILRNGQKKLHKQYMQIEMKEYSIQSVSYWLVHGFKADTFHYSFCDEKHCVNPNHIKESTTWYNVRSFSTTCTKGHDLSHEGSYIEYLAPGGKVYKKCKVCKNAARRALNERTRNTAEHSDRVEQTRS